MPQWAPKLGSLVPRRETATTSGYEKQSLFCPPYSVSSAEMKGCWKPRRLLKGSMHRLLAGTHSKLWLTECSLGDAETEFCDFRVRDSGAATIVPSLMQGVGQFHLSCVEPSLPYGQIEICTDLVKSTCSTLVTTRGSQWLNFTGSWQAVSDLWVPWAFCRAHRETFPSLAGHGIPRQSLVAACLGPQGSRSLCLHVQHR